VLVVNGKGHHVANRLDALYKFQRRGGEKQYSAIYPKKVRCVGWGKMKYTPLRMSAFEMVGTSTISSTGFPVGSVCRDRRVYDSGYASLEYCEKKQKQDERT
jgi:hypothetical protein